MTRNHDSLLKFAKSGDADEREHAARELNSLLPEERAVHLLSSLLGDEDWRVRRASVESFLSSDFSTVRKEIFDALYDEENAGRRNAAIDVLTRAGKKIVPFAGEHLRSDNKDVRMFIINILGDLRDETYLQEILQATHEKDPNLVSAALLAIGKIADPETKPVVLQFLRSTDPWLKFQAIEAAGQMQDPDFLDLLITNVQDLLYRRVALRALGNFHDAASYRVLMGHILSLEDGFREALDSLFDLYNAVQPSVLASREREQIKAEWKSILATNDQGLKRLEQKAIELEYEDKQKVMELIGWAQPPSEVRAAETPYPDEFVPAENPRTLGVARFDGVWEARQFSTTEEDRVALLLQAVKNEASEVREEAVQRMGKTPRPEFLHALISALADEQPRVRELAARALGGYQDSESDKPLLGCTKDDSVRVRIAAYESLAEKRAGEIAPLLAERLPSETPPAQAILLKSCHRLKPELGIELALQYSYSRDPEVRETACEVLALGGEASHTKRILELLESDSEWRVRSAALQALCRQNKPELPALLIDHFARETDLMLRSEILQALKRLELEILPDFLFAALLNKHLTDDAYEILKRNKQRHRNAIAQAARKQHPDVRRILTSLLIH